MMINYKLIVSRTTSPMNLLFIDLKYVAMESCPINYVEKRRLLWCRICHCCCRCCFHSNWEMMIFTYPWWFNHYLHMLHFWPVITMNCVGSCASLRTLTMQMNGSYASIFLNRRDGKMELLFRLNWWLRKVLFSLFSWRLLAIRLTWFRVIVNI